MQPNSRRYKHVAICNILLFLSLKCSKKSDTGNSNTKLHPAVNNLLLSAASGHLDFLTFKQPTYAFTLSVLMIFSLFVLHRKWGQTASFVIYSDVFDLLAGSLYPILLVQQLRAGGIEGRACKQAVCTVVYIVHVCCIMLFLCVLLCICVHSTRFEK